MIRVLDAGAVRVIVGPVVSIVNVLFVGALAVLPPESTTDESDTVAVPSIYVLPFAELTV